MVLQTSGTARWPVTVSHGYGPYTAGDTADNAVLGVHAVREEERKVRGEVVDIHASSEISLDIGKSIGQREGELGDGVGAGLGDVVPGN